LDSISHLRIPQVLTNAPSSDIANFAITFNNEVSVSNADYFMTLSPLLMVSEVGVGKYCVCTGFDSNK